MATIDYKQKIKDYMNSSEVDTLYKSMLNNLFPELKESEDERIRKAIIEHFEGSHSSMYPYKGFTKEQILAWLEKQGEQKTEVKYVYTKFQIGDTIVEIKPNGYCQPVRVKYIGDGAYSCESDDGKRSLSFPIINQDDYELVEQKPIISNNALREGITHFGITQYQIDNWLKKYVDVEKQDEQKPVVIIPKFRVGDEIKTSNEESLTITKIDEKGYWSEDLFICCFDEECVWDLVEQKPAWSEENEKMFEHIIAKATLHFSSINYLDEEEINFLKSLRPQNNITDEELAQAKKDAYNDALNKIEYHSGEPTFDDGWGAAIWYLKKRNAQPQNTWKPSDEQMKALDFAADCIVPDEFCFKRKALKELYKDLKKLREE